jgi:hypothetical protein
MIRTNDGIREYYDGIMFLVADRLWTLSVQTATARAVDQDGYEFVANLSLNGNGQSIRNVGVRVSHPNQWPRERVCSELSARLANGQLRSGNGYHFG